jgi:hypothetical protein
MAEPDLAALPGVSIGRWVSGFEVEAIQQVRDARKGTSAVIWIDVAGATDWFALAEALDAIGLAGYERAMLGHTLHGIGPHDHGAEHVSWYSRDVARRLNSPGQPRYLEAFGLNADIAPGVSDPPWLFIQPVHFLVGSSWLITSRKPGTASDGLNVRIGDRFPSEELRRSARERFPRSPRAGDLAIVLLRQLVETYRLALADLDRRLQDLQQGYMRGRDESPNVTNLDEAQYRAALLQVKWVVDGLSRSLVRLSRPATRTSGAWFEVERREATAAEVGELVERAERTLAGQRAELRESFALIAASQASEQLALARKIAEEAARADHRARRFETLVQYAAAVFLLPTLVAQILGGLPDIYRDCPPRRAIVVAGGTLAAVAVSVGLLYWYRKHHDETRSTTDETSC